ncbi:MAG: DUF177 domain-containing protein [Deltaproteobacteria bacterium]|jgi:uncharacterized metal-binding protein YceD (DUF177 family)|nr:DUF177 domain-containing protein [Deltaproteobacteria bacterium]MBP6829298.1 DUF177 domain-containing protein [Deltaproteobacteria bacterium]
MAPPVILFDRIPDDGLQQELVLDEAWLTGVYEGTGLMTVAGAPGHASVRLDKDKRNVFMSGRFEVTAQTDCVACLERMTFTMSADLVLHLEPAGSTKPGKAVHEEVELSRDELDVDVYTDDRIDLAHWLREAILLEAPLHPRHEVCPVKLEMPAAPPLARDGIDPRLAPLARFIKKE